MLSRNINFNRVELIHGIVVEYYNEKYLHSSIHKVYRKTDTPTALLLWIPVWSYLQHIDRVPGVVSPVSHVGQGHDGDTQIGTRGQLGQPHHAWQHGHS